MDYSKMSDFEINCAVARAAGLEAMMFFDVDSSFCHGPVWNVSSGVTDDGFKISRGNPFNPCNNPADAWPIISANRISIEYDAETQCDVPVEWVTAYGIVGLKVHVVAHQPCDKALRAAAIVFLMMQESADVQDNPA